MSRKKSIGSRQKECEESVSASPEKVPPSMHTGAPSGRYDEYCGEILEGCNNYVNVSRDDRYPVDIAAILPLVEQALSASLQDGQNHAVKLPTRRYLIGQRSNGHPDLWGMKPDNMNRETGKPYEPEYEFNYIAEFFSPQGMSPEATLPIAKQIAEAIAENELDLAYIAKP